MFYWILHIRDDICNNCNLITSNKPITDCQYLKKNRNVKVRPILTFNMLVQIKNK